MVLISKRREYIEIQQGTRTSDGQGGYTVGWAFLAYDWARAVVLSQSRALDQGGIKYTKTVEFTLRVSNAYTLSPAYRIVWESENYAIHSIIRSEKNDNITVLCYA